MTEYELLEAALKSIQKSLPLLESAYQQHDHDKDILGGALISSSLMFTRACEESLITLMMHVSQVNHE
jgi:hypothetical protein